MMVIDGNDVVLGRLASFVARRLLEGESVTILNAEQVVISGRAEATFEAYKAWLGTRNIANPRKGPFHPKRPEEIVRRAIRGMMPYRKAHGMAAFRRLRVHRGVPEDFAGQKMVSVPDASLQLLGTRRYIRVGDLSKKLGAGLS